MSTTDPPDLAEAHAGMLRNVALLQRGLTNITLDEFGEMDRDTLLFLATGNKIEHFGKQESRLRKALIDRRALMLEAISHHGDDVPSNRGVDGSVEVENPPGLDPNAPAIPPPARDNPAGDGQDDTRADLTEHTAADAAATATQGSASKGFQFGGSKDVDDKTAGKNEDGRGVDSSLAPDGSPILLDTLDTAQRTDDTPVSKGVCRLNWFGHTKETDADDIGVEFGRSDDKLPAPVTSPLFNLNASAVVADQLRQFNFPEAEEIVTKETLDEELRFLRHGIQNSVDMRFEEFEKELKEDLNARFDDLKRFWQKEVDGSSHTSPVSIQNERVQEAAPSPPGARRALNLDTIAESDEDTGSGLQTPMFMGRPVNLGPLPPKDPIQNCLNYDKSGGVHMKGSDVPPSPGQLSTPLKWKPATTSTPPPGNPYSVKGLRGHSPLNDPQRAKMNSKYLVGNDGVTSLEDINGDFLTSLNIPLDQQEDLGMATMMLLQKYSAPEIRSKYLGYFTKLKDLTMTVFIAWYTKFRFELRKYSVGLVHFDAVMLQWQSLGLCYPGVGASRYLQMTESLFSVLSHALPLHIPVVKDCYNSMAAIHHDGYKLLWSIMRRALPVFCPSITPSPPLWSDIQNVADIATEWLSYFRFMSKKGVYYSPSEKSSLFLNSIQEHSYAGMKISIAGDIQRFNESRAVSEFDDPESHQLPHNLTIEGIVNTLTTSQTSLTASVSYATSNLTVEHVADQPDDSSSPSTSIPNLQGAWMCATRRRPAPTRGGRRSNSPRRSTNQDKKNIFCGACGKRGHEEISCRRLGELLVLSKRMESLPPGLKRKIVDSYKEFYGTPPPPKANNTCSKQLDQFCAARNIGISDVVSFYDWDAFCDSTSASGDDSSSDEEDIGGSDKAE